jgi:hypothetical protein
MSLLALSGTNSVSGGYDIDNSVKLEADNVEFMDRAISTTGNRKTWTHSSWVKRTEISFAGDGFGHTFFFGGAYGSEACILRFNTGTTAATLDTLQIDIGFGGTLSRSHTSQVFRDTSAWYHIVLAVDTTQSTATDRFKLYVNGELVTSYYNRNNPTQNFDTSNNYQSSGYVNNVGAYKSGGTTYGKFCGYIAESYNIDGSALAPTAFGEFDEDSGIWKPKEYTGSFPNNSWYLKFDDSGALGADSSGNGNTFTLNNITSADQATDTPTNNFCTLNPLIYDINSGDDESYICFNGATSIAASKNAYAQNYATIGLNIASGGKWYFEWTATSTANGSSTEALCGLAFDTQWDAGSLSTAVYNAGFAFYAAGFGHGEGYAANVVNGLLIDLDNNKVKWYKNGSLHVTMPDDGGGSTMQTSGYAFPYIAPYGSGFTINVNFGGYTAQTVSSGNTDPNGYGNFEYPTQGGYAICTKNLAEYG